MSGGGKRGEGKSLWTEAIDLLASGFGVGVVASRGRRSSGRCARSWGLKRASVRPGAMA